MTIYTSMTMYTSNIHIPNHVSAQMVTENDLGQNNI